MQINRLKRGRVRVSTAGGVSLVLLLVFLAGVWPAAVRAVEMTSLYTAEVPLDPDDPEAQTNAFREALAEVLVRVTGSRAAAAAGALTALFPNPVAVVRQYRQGPGGSLIVSLDGPAIELALRQSGATVWGLERPLTIVWLAVDRGRGDREIVPANDPDALVAGDHSVDRNRLLRERVQAAATRRGLPIVFPLLDLDDREKTGFADVWGGFEEPLLQASARYAAPSVLLGRIRPDEMQQPRWTWYIGGQRFSWPGDPEQAIDQLADALAAREAIRGDQNAELIELTVTGIDSVVAYGEVQHYMENLRVIDKLRVKLAASDRIVYDAEVRGGRHRLEKALAAGKLLERDERGYFIDGTGMPFDAQTGPSAQALRYHYRPPNPPAPAEIREY